MPANYKKGKTRYVFVMGTVMSGLGKGIFSSCLAKLLQDKGLRVAPIKLEGYLNIDSGTLNPFRHGEVFVLDDGMETDMDLGTYERILDQDLSRANFATSGQIFSSVLHKERHGDYLGRDVQMIPHVTGEWLRGCGAAAEPRRRGFRRNRRRSATWKRLPRQTVRGGREARAVACGSTPSEPPALGEQKSKAAQLGIKQVMQLGIQPDIIVCRATNPVNDKARQKISIYSNVPFERVISLHDSASIYMIPAMLRDHGLDFEVLRLLKSRTVSLRRQAWAVV
jgi:CTP synthase